MNTNYRKVLAIDKKNKERLLKVNPELDDKSGIYFLTRIDNNSIKYAYIGQAKHILTRLAQHLSGHEQHIDKSLKKHGLYTHENPYGWKIGFMHFKLSELDEKEHHYIKMYAVNGYQMRNKTAGGQGEGKTQIGEYKPHKGYYDGIRQGKITLARELRHIADKHLAIELKAEKRANKTSQKALEKFMTLINEDHYKESADE